MWTSSWCTPVHAGARWCTLVHAEKLSERVSYYSEQHLEMRERDSSSNELLTWAECSTLATTEHPHPWPTWNFSERFPDMPCVYRRSVIKDAIGKVRAYLSHRRAWEKSGKNQGKPGLPGASNHPSLYQGTIEQQSPRLVLRKKAADLVSRLSLPGQCRPQCIKECASLILSPVALAASEKDAAAGGTKRLGWRTRPPRRTASGGRSLSEGHPGKDWQARPAGR